MPISDILSYVFLFQKGWMLRIQKWRASFLTTINLTIESRMIWVVSRIWTTESILKSDIERSMESPLRSSLYIWIFSGLLCRYVTLSPLSFFIFPFLFAHDTDDSSFSFLFYFCNSCYLHRSNINYTMNVTYKHLYPLFPPCY